MLLAQEPRLVRLVLQTTHGTDQILAQLAPQELTQQEDLSHHVLVALQDALYALRIHLVLPAFRPFILTQVLVNHVHLELGLQQEQHRALTALLDVLLVRMVLLARAVVHSTT